MKAAVVVFPGSNCDHDCYHVLKHVLGVDTRFVWHKERELPAVDLVVLPGGFSYGDYLRSGAIARLSPVMEAVGAHAQRGGLVFGICNGFQVLTEAHLLEGALLVNRGLKFVCADVALRVEHADSALTRRCEPGAELVIPVAHNDGCYFIGAEGLARLEGEGQVLLRYVDDDGTVKGAAALNGAVGSIAGICNAAGNVFGMMPHPERCTEPLVGGPAHGGANSDGRALFEGLLDAAGGR
jgi:phosphoribosylformylglycinamidine synthase